MSVLCRRAIAALGSLLVSVAVTLAVAPSASAGPADQPIEWSAYKPGKTRYSLSHAGLTPGCKKGVSGWNADHKFWINLNANHDPDRFRLYSDRRTTQLAFANKAPIGYDLATRRPYICLGITDTARAGGPGWTQASLFVWVS